MRPMGPRSIFPLCPFPIAHPRRGTYSHRPPTKGLDNETGITRCETGPAHRKIGRNSCIGVSPSRVLSR